MEVKENYNETLIKRSLHAIRYLQDKLEKSEKHSSEPIAIIGMGCRFPGGCNTPEEFWKLLSDCTYAVTEVPPDRWDADRYYDKNTEAIGKTYVKEAGFLTGDIGAFDAKFFGISPREAMEMDPQQRLLLETSWEAVERAGMAAALMKGSNTGVFVGISGSEYAMIPRDPANSGPYTATGIACNIASGRLAHIFGFNGPAISVDTACSSSLAAVHLACESLRRGECEAAIAGGVNLMLLPNSFIMLSKVRALAPDGKCKVFDADGNGYVRAEGCGIVVLKKLAEAKSDGDNILAVIKGTAINQDGLTSGLTVPNGIAQRCLLKAALDDANVLPEDVGYIETHGTGTPLGDPIEMQAISDVYGGRKTESGKLIIGAVKSNIGHLEAASGIAGLIKVVLCIMHGQVPPNLHFKTLNPRINLDKIPAVIPLQMMPWGGNGGKRLAGLSSFGFSGTNVHMIISEAEHSTSNSSEGNNIQLLTISAKDENALKAQIAQLYTYLCEHSETALEDICYTANVCRMHFSHRAVFIAESNEQMAEKLKQQLETFPCEQRKKILAQHRTGMMFGGNTQNIQRTSGRLYQISIDFRKAFDACSELFERYVGYSVSKKLYTNELTEDILRVILFCTEYAQLELWHLWGVEMQAAAGEKTGQFIAAYAAGIMTLPQAVKKAAKYAGFTVNESEEDEEYSISKLRFISTETGEEASENEYRNMEFWNGAEMKPDIMEKSIEKLKTYGYSHFIVLGDAAYDPSEVEDAWERMLNSLAALYLDGFEIDWDRFHHNGRRKKIVLPTYPFQKTHYWLETYSGTQDLQDKLENHDPLKCCKLESPLAAKQFELCINTNIFPELRDNKNVLHIGYYLEFLSSTASKLYGSSAFHIREMELYQTMYFYDSIDKKVQLIVEEPDEFDVSVFKIYSKDAGQKMWILHAQGRIQKNTTVIYSRVTNEECKKIQERCEKEYDYEGFNEKLNNQGFTVGESVKWADHVWYGNNEVLVKFRMPTENENVRTYSLDMHPGILDACAQMFLLGGKRYLGDDKMFMVVKIDEFIYYSQKKVDELWCYLKVQEDLTTEGYIRGDYKLFDGSGICVAQANGKQVKIIDPERKEALRKVMEKEAEDNGHTVNLKLLTKLNSATQEDKASILSERFRYLFSEILKIPLQEVDIHEPLANMGMDSLVGYEMKTAIERELNIKMPMEILIQGTPITELAGSVLRLMNTNIAEEEDEEKWYREEYKMDPSLWIAFRKKKPDAKFRLFCIPYGAVGASMYRDWNEALPSYVDVCPIQFPGKETRITEKPIMTISEAVDCLTKVLADELDIPYAFYGHSVGALLAYRTTHKLSENDGNKPKHLFVGAYSSPTINPNPACERVMTAFHLVGIGGEEIPEFDKLMQLSDDDRELIDKFFAAEMERVNVNDTIRRAIEPVAFSEFAIVDSYHFNQQETVMKVPITAFYGEQDPVVTLDDMKKWEVLTEDKFELNVLTGDHFFIHKDQNRDEVLNMVSERIKQYI